MSDLAAPLQALADEIVGADGGPRGAVLAVSSGGRTVAVAAGLARADLDVALTPAHRFHVASVGKMCTAAMVLQALEAGEFADGLATTLTQLGDAGLLDPLLAARVHPDAHRVTLHHLLTHTSGLKDMQVDDASGTADDFGGMPAPASIQGRFWADLRSRADGGPGDGFADHRWTGWDAQRPDDPMAGLLNRFLATGTAASPVAAPGQRFHYSDTGYTLLATVIEAVYGRPYHEVQRRDVLVPLGMTHTYQSYREDPVDARAKEMDVWAGSIALLSGGFDLSFDWGGGGQVSTVGDLCALVQGFTAGRLFRDPTTLGLATSWLAPPGLPAPRTGIGLGLHRWQLGGHEVVGHAGAWGVRAFVEPATGIVAASSVGRRDDCPWFGRLFELACDS